jgi:excisionase family DNA binding protein
MSIDKNDKLISVKEAAQQCRRNTETVRRWIWSGKLPAEKLGNQLFIQKSALESYCREAEVMAYQAGPNHSGSRSLVGKTREKHMNQSETMPRRQIVEQMRSLTEKMQARLSQDFTADETDNLLHQMRAGEMSELNEVIQREIVSLPPGSRTGLIQKMRDLRQQIRTHIGRDFTEAEINEVLYKMREDRDNEISGLR